MAGGIAKLKSVSRRTLVIYCIINIYMSSNETHVKCIVVSMIVLIYFKLKISTLLVFEHLKA